MKSFFKKFYKDSQKEEKNLREFKTSGQIWIIVTKPIPNTWPNQTG